MTWNFHSECPYFSLPQLYTHDSFLTQFKTVFKHPTNGFSLFLFVFLNSTEVCVLHYQFSAQFYDACSVFRSQNFCKVIGEAGKRSMLCQHTT